MRLLSSTSQAARLLAIPLIWATVACASRQSDTSNADSAPESGAIIVRGSDLTGDLLEGLRARIPTMRVARLEGECPRIIFRGQRSMRNQGNPTVYVDGTLMRDTCVLSQISVAEVDHVEVYPSGNTSRVGVQRNPFGLIMVFRVRA